METLQFVLGFVAGTMSGTLMPAFLYFVGATFLALIFGWGNIGVENVDNVKVLKLPGGGLLASIPLPEFVLLSIILSSHVLLNANMTLLSLGLSFMFLVRMIAWLLSHFFAFLGSWSARNSKMSFSLECMDSRLEHGSRSGNFLHDKSCGGFTLLTAIGFSPLVIFPVIFGLPEGTLGLILLGIFCFPYPLVFSKLFVNYFSHSNQVLIKRTVDGLMFLTEIPGWVIGSFTLSLASWRLMFPGVTKTHFHK